jgi:alpha-tubulin suppressor-like RCC1 family protein
MKQFIASIMLIAILASCGVVGNKMTVERAQKSLLGFTLSDPDFLNYDKGRAMGEVTGIIETGENKIEILFTVLNIPCNYMCNPEKWRPASTGKATAFVTTDGKWMLDCIAYQDYYGSLLFGRQSCNLNRDMDEMADVAFSVPASASASATPIIQVEPTAAIAVVEQPPIVTQEAFTALPIPQTPIRSRVCGGHLHGAAVKDNGTVIGWGNNNQQQAVTPNGVSNISAVYCVGDTTFGITKTGTVMAWGDNQSGIRDIPVGLSNVIKIAGIKNWNDNYSYAIALKSDGSLVGWGDNTYGVLDIPENLNDVVDVSGGFRHVIALKQDGTLVGWGTDNYYANADNISQLSNLTTIVAISTGYAHSMALKHDGTVTMWGNNDHNQTSVPVGLSNVSQIFTGMWYSFALKNDGTLTGWGYDEYGQLNISDLSGVVDIGGTPSTSFVVLRDGTLIGRGHNGFGEIPVGINLTDN